MMNPYDGKQEQQKDACELHVVFVNDSTLWILKESQELKPRP